MDGAEPGGGVEESVFLSCDRATVRVNARLGLVDEEDLAGGVGRMVVAWSAMRLLSRRSGRGT